MLSYYGWILVIGLIVGGIIGLIDVIGQKNAGLAEKIKSYESYFGYIGAAILGIGIWNLIYISGIIAAIKVVPVFAIVLIVALVAAVMLGLLLGAGILSNFSAVEDIVDKIAEKLVPIKIPVSIVAFCSGLYLLIASILGLRF